IGLFDTPIAIAVDDQENMYVVDQGNYRVQRFDRFGLFQFAFGRQGMGDGEFTQQTIKVPPSPIPVPVLKETGEFEFNKPMGIYLDRDSTRNLIRIHVADSLNNRIQRFLVAPNSEQDFETFFDPFTASGTNIFILLTRSGNAVDTALHDLFKNDNTRQAILDPLYLRADISGGKANSTTLTPFVWGGLGFTQGQLNTPTYLVKDENNVLWVSDTGNGRVEGFNVSESNPANDATYFREFGDDINLPYGAGRLNQPTSIAYDNQGIGGFLVLDKLQSGGYAIEKFDRDGRFTGVFAASGDKEGQLKQPVAIAVNTFDNTCFVTDRGLRKIMVYSNKGDFMYEFGGDELADPRGITVLRNGYVYVTDAAKNMVYRYVPQ
ncbi:MAG: NHL repeat-containing protein, partial [Nitrospirota bacterium]